MNNLRKWRNEHKITQKQLGAILGVSRSQIANIEGGKNRLTINLAAKIASSNLEIINLCGTDIFKEEQKEIEKLGYDLKAVKKR